MGLKDWLNLLGGYFIVAVVLIIIPLLGFVIGVGISTLIKDLL